MGLFKKIFKPVRKVLDKVIPNELKPFLPYAAAAVPFLAPASLGGPGLAGLLKRGLITGVMPNIASQLAQEGADDNINLLSAALAGTTGALTAGDAANTLRSGILSDTTLPGQANTLSLLDKGRNIGLRSLAKGADFLGNAASTLQNPKMNMETLKAASVPFIQGTADAMAFEAEAAMRAYEKELAAYNAEMGNLGTDAGRREAILAAMRAYNHPEELIEETLAELGLKDGGRIALKNGGDLVGIETLRLGDYDLEGFENRGKGNTLRFGSDDLKRISQALEFGALADLSDRKKEKIKEAILLARAGITNPTELNAEIGELNLNESQKDFLFGILPDETISNIFMDEEGDFRSGFQKLRALGENLFFGGQKDPTQQSDMYNKLSDAYIDDQKKSIQRRINFNKEDGDRNFLNFNAGGRIGYEKGGLLGLLGGTKAENDNTSNYISKVSPTKEVDTMYRIYEEDGHEGLQAYLERNPDLKYKYVINVDAMSDELSVVPNKLHEDFLNMEMIIPLKAKGGRVGLEFGGIPAAVQNIKDDTYNKDMALLDMDIDWVSLAQEFEETFNRPHQNDKELFDFYRDKYGADGMAKRTEIAEKFTETAANGGIMSQRKPFVSGGIGKGLLKLLGKSDDAADIAQQTKTFKEGPITAEFPENVDKTIINPAIRTRDMSGSGGYGIYKNFREMPAGLQAAELISRIKRADGTIDYEAAEIFIGKKLRGNETIDELIAMVVKPQNVGSPKKGVYDITTDRQVYYDDIDVPERADGGIMNYNMGGSVLPDGIEVDYRGGGFIPMGSAERADDVPARVSKNEFVMTADAVRAAGEGSVNKGAKRMYDLMNTLEARA